LLPRYLDIGINPKKWQQLNLGCGIWDCGFGRINCPDACFRRKISDLKTILAVFSLFTAS
jgi:hypothetical protein